MGRLIDADVLITELKESALHHCNNPREDCLLQRDRVIVRAQPTVEAIPKADYETRLKADMVAMLTEILLEAEENTVRWYVGRVDGKSDDVVLMETLQEIIQQKIDALKGGEDEMP